MTTGASNINVIWQQGQRTVGGSDTSRAAAVGLTERGPIGVRTTVFSKEDFRKIFGGYFVHAESDLSITVDSFFDNGGTALDVVRTCHYSDPTTPIAVVGTLDLTTFTAGSPTAGTETSSGSEPFSLAANDTLIVDPDAGGIQTFTFLATEGYVESNNVFPSDQDGLTLNVSIDGGPTRTIQFPATTTDTLVLILAAINAAGIPGLYAYDNGGAIRIASDSKGSGSSVAIVAGGTTTLSFDAPVAGTGSAANIDKITAAEAAVLIMLTAAGFTASDVGGQLVVTSATTGATSSVQVTGTAQVKFGFDGALHAGSDAAITTTLTVNGKTPGAYANSLYAVISAASNGNAAQFNFAILRNGSVEEAWPNVTMDQALARYIGDIVNDAVTGSNLVALVDPDIMTGGGYSEEEARPTNGTYGPLAGGDDGLAGLVDSDFIGSEVENTGLYALDNEEGVRLLTVPGHASASIHTALNTYIEHREKTLYVVHPTPGPAQSVTDVATMRTWAEANLYGTTEFGCCAWPRIKIPNPSVADYGTGDFVVVGSEMAKMGRFAYNDRFNADGVFVSTAGIKDARGVIQNCLGVEYTDLEIQSKADHIAEVNIEPIRKFKGTSYHWDGGDSLTTDGDWPRQWHGRGAISIVTTLKNNALWVKHSKNNAKNRGEWERQGNRYLDTLPGDAFDEDRGTFWQVSDALNDPAVRSQQRMRGKLGLGFSDDAKYVEIIVTRTVAQSS